MWEYWPLVSKQWFPLLRGITPEHARCNNVSKISMSNRRSITPRVQENKIYLDSDSQSDSEHSDDDSEDEDSEDYIPSDLRENESEDDSEHSDNGVGQFTDQVQPSTSRGVRGGRRGRVTGSARMTRGAARLLERQQNDSLWTEEGLHSPPHAPTFKGKSDLNLFQC